MIQLHPIWWRHQRRESSPEKVPDSFDGRLRQTNSQRRDRQHQRRIVLLDLTRGSANLFDVGRRRGRIPAQRRSLTCRSGPRLHAARRTRPALPTHRPWLLISILIRSNFWLLTLYLFVWKFWCHLVRWLLSMWFVAGEIDCIDFCLNNLRNNQVDQIWICLYINAEKLDQLHALITPIASWKNELNFAFYYPYLCGVISFEFWFPY